MKVVKDGPYIVKVLSKKNCFKMEKDLRKENKRGNNFLKSEEDKLVRLFLKYKHIIENKKTDAATSKKKQEVWQKLTSEFNASNVQFRSVQSIKDKYKNIKRNIRQNKAAGRRNRFLNRDGPSTKENTTGGTIDKLCDAIGISINGLDSRLDDAQMDDVVDVKIKNEYIEDLCVVDEMIEADIVTNQGSTDYIDDEGTVNTDSGSINDEILSLKKKILEKQYQKLKLENEECALRMEEARIRMEQATTEHLMRLELLKLKTIKLQREILQ